MKAWISLILVGSMIIMSSFVAGCADNKDRGKTNKSLRGSNQVQPTINQLKNYSCHLSDEVNTLNQKSTLSCTDFDSKTDKEKLEIRDLLITLRDKSDVYSKTPRLNKNEKGKYELLTNEAQRELDRITLVINGLADKKMESLEEMEKALTKKIATGIEAVNLAVEGLTVVDRGETLGIKWEPDVVSSKSKDMALLEKKAVALKKFRNLIEVELPKFGELQDNEELTTIIANFKRDSRDGLKALREYENIFTVALSLEYILKIEETLKIIFSDLEATLKGDIDLKGSNINLVPGIQSPFSASATEDEVSSVSELRLGIYTSSEENNALNDLQDILELEVEDSYLFSLPVSLGDLTIKSGESILAVLKSSLEKLAELAADQGAYGKYKANMAFASQIDEKRQKVYQRIDAKMKEINSTVVDLKKQAQDEASADPGNT